MVIWNDLEKPWKLAMELAWESFKSGSLPIAAVIVDLDENVVAIGRNRILEPHFKNRKMAHAEMTALMDLDHNKHPEIPKYTMYATLEPCPMCMGTIVMSDVRKLRIASRDPWAGAVGICEFPYIASKNMDIIFEDSDMSKIITVVYLYRLLEGYRTNAVNFMKSLAKHFPIEIEFAQKLLSENVLRDFADNGTNIEEAYNYLGGKLSL